MLYFARIGSKMDDISRVGALERELARPPPDESKMPEKVDEDQPSGSDATDEHGGTDECDGGPTDECGGTTDECCGPTDGDTTDEYGGTTDEYSCMTDDSSSSDYTGATIIILRYKLCTLRCLLIASTKFSVLEGACIWLVLILAILQVGCLSEMHACIH